MRTSLPHSAVAIAALLLVMNTIPSGTHAQTVVILKNGDVFENRKYSSDTTYDANANLKDEKSYSSTITWMSCTVSSNVTVQGTFDLDVDFPTSLYFMLEKTTFTAGSQFDFYDLPPNAYIHALQTTAIGATQTVYIIRPTTDTNNITTLIDESTISYADATKTVFVSLAVPPGSPFIVTHLRNAQLTNLYIIFSTTTCTDGSTIFLEQITCTGCRWDLVGLDKVSAVSKQSAIILKGITIIDHGFPTRDGLLRTSSAVVIDATSVLALVDIDLTNGFTATTPLRLFFKTELTGTGAIVLLRIKMGSSGLTTLQPTNNVNFWVVAKQTASTIMTTAQLQAVFLNVNVKNVINWDGTGANGKCVQAGLALPNTATYALVGGQCEATCPQGNYLPPACTPRAVCTGVPNCKACYAYPKDKCLECEPHTTPENNDTMCKCPISECVTCPTATLCTNCTTDYKFSPANNSCYHCIIDNCAVCNENDKCSTCEDGYKLYNNQCIPCNIQNCLYCQEAGKCYECAADYILTTDATNCFLCTMPGCLECSADGVCGECQNGYVFVPSSTPTDNKCVRCQIDIPQCKTCEVDSICSECNTDYKPANDDTDCFQCTIPGCAECSADGVCGECENGYFLEEQPSTPTDNKCVHCDIANCQVCKVDSVCSECNTDYKPANAGTICFQCIIPGCAECSADGVCGECDVGYLLVPSTTPTDNKCLRCQIDIPKCKTCEVDSVCSECDPDYKLANAGKNCFQCTIPFCETCSADGVCASCNAGYSLVKSQVVPTDNKCVHCSIDKCEACESDDVCSECTADHKPANQGSECFYCTTPNCAECRSDGVCGTCNDGYSLVESSSTPTDNKCVHCDIENCQACKVDDICSTCADGGYTLSPDGLRCTLCNVDGCQRCDLPNTCALCSEGMAANTHGQCVSCAVEDCLYCSKNNMCTVCNCDQVPSDDGKSCVPCNLSSCSYCDPLGGGAKCTECADGYKVSGSGVCTKIVLAQWVVFLIVVAAVIVLIVVLVVGYILYQRRVARLAEMAADAEERRRNRSCRSAATRSQLSIAVLDLGDIEDAASGVPDTISRRRP